MKKNDSTYIEEIFDNDNQIALIIRNNFKSEKNSIKFFTPNSFSQQIGVMNRPKGYKISPHIHKRVKREVLYTNEVLFIRKGTVKVDFYDDKKNFLEARKVYAGDILLLIRGGHGFTIIEEADIYEIKQGPYVGETDKLRF